MEMTNPGLNPAAKAVEDNDPSFPKPHKLEADPFVYVLRYWDEGRRSKNISHRRTMRKLTSARDWERHEMRQGQEF